MTKYHWVDDKKFLFSKEEVPQETLAIKKKTLFGNVGYLWKKRGKK